MIGTLELIKGENPPTIPASDRLDRAIHEKDEKWAAQQIDKGYRQQVWRYSETATLAHLEKVVDTPCLVYKYQDYLEDPRRVRK